VSWNLWQGVHCALTSPTIKKEQRATKVTQIPPIPIILLTRIGHLPENLNAVLQLTEKKIPSLKCFPDDETIRKFLRHLVKIPLNPPL
jgi:hypothetical protein